LVDNVLGLHLPLLQVVWDRVDFTLEEDTAVSGIADADPAQYPYPTMSDNFRTETEATAATVEASNTPMPQKQIAQRIFVKADLLANYFNNIKKCWEPLLERLSFTVLGEENPLRGYGT
jgi:hypothetical protein